MVGGTVYGCLEFNNSNIVSWFGAMLRCNNLPVHMQLLMPCASFLFSGSERTSGVGGKKHMLFNESPPDVRQSTPVMERPVQAILTLLKNNSS